MYVKTIVNPCAEESIYRLAMLDFNKPFYSKNTSFVNLHLDVIEVHDINLLSILLLKFNSTVFEKFFGLNRSNFVSYSLQLMLGFSVGLLQAMTENKTEKEEDNGRSLNCINTSLQGIFAKNCLNFLWKCRNIFQGKKQTVVYYGRLCLLNTNKLYKITLKIYSQV